MSCLKNRSDQISVLVSLLLGMAAIAPPAALAQDDSLFPATAAVLVDGKFQRCEGIAFNGEGELYVTGNHKLWRVSLDGEVTEVAEMHSNLGLAPIGDRDLLVADFGPTNRFDLGPNVDGIVWRITPEGEKTRVVDGGIGDPNFVLVRPDSTILVTDDATDEIMLVLPDGRKGVISDAVGHPNGLALSADGATLYVAQIFKSIRPFVTDGRVWALPMTGGMPSGAPEVVADLGDAAANDGLAMDELGRLYVAANGSGQIWRLDPATREQLLIAEEMPGAASIAFGAGEFDHQSIYVTSTRTGKVWAIHVGIAGAALHR